MSLYFFDTVVQKVKNDQKLKSRGPALNSMKRDTFQFQHSCVSKVITTAHVHKSGVVFHIFPRPFKQNKKIKKLRPGMKKGWSSGVSG